MANFTTTTLTEVEKSNLYSEFNNKTLNLDTVESKNPRYKEFVDQTTGQNLLVNALRAGDYSYLNKIPDSYREQETFMLPLLFAVKNGNLTYAVFSYFSSKLQDDPELGSMIIVDEPHLINNTPLASNKEFIIQNAKYYPAILQYASPSLTTDPTFWVELNNYDPSTKDMSVEATTGVMTPAAVAVTAAALGQVVQEEANKAQNKEENLETTKDTVVFIRPVKTLAQIEEEASEGIVKEENLEQAIYAAKVHEGSATVEDLQKMLDTLAEKLENRKNMPQDAKTLIAAGFLKSDASLIMQQLEALEKQGIDVSAYRTRYENLRQERRDIQLQENSTIFGQFSDFAKKISTLKVGSPEYLKAMKDFLSADPTSQKKEYNHYRNLTRVMGNKGLAPEQLEECQLALMRIKDYGEHSKRVGFGMKPLSRDVITPEGHSRTTKLVKTTTREDALEQIRSHLKWLSRKKIPEETKKKWRENLIKLKKQIEQYGPDAAIVAEEFDKYLADASRLQPEEYEVGSMLYEDLVQQQAIAEAADKAIEEIDASDTKMPQQEEGFRDNIEEQPQVQVQTEPVKADDQPVQNPITIEDQTETKGKGTPADVTEMTKELDSSKITDVMGQVKAKTTEREMTSPSIYTENPSK